MANLYWKRRGCLGSRILSYLLCRKTNLLVRTPSESHNKSWKAPFQSAQLASEMYFTQAHNFFWIPESIIETTLLLSILLWIKAGFSFYHSRSTSTPFQNFTYQYTWPTSLLFKCIPQIETVWEMDIIISFKDGRRQRRVIDHWCFRP